MKSYLSKINILIFKLLIKIGPRTLDFVSTTFLAGLWAQTGFMLWKRLPWYCSLFIWLLYLIPVGIGFYLSGKIDEHNQKVYLRAIAEVPPGAGLIDINNKLEEISNTIINSNSKSYNKLEVFGFLFFVFVFFDIIITILLYAKNLV